MATSLIKKSMRLFGAPYQFTNSVDPRISGISNKVGTKYLNNIMLEAPVVTIIPGKPKYLPASKKNQKISTTQALLKSASNGFSSLENYLGKKGKTKKMRIYDFERDYTDYMNYVNILCRTGATFLELDQKLDGVPLQSYDWRNYRQTAKNYKQMVGGALSGISKSVKKAFTTGGGKTEKEDPSKFKYDTTSSIKAKELSTLEENLTNFNFVQFYVDPDITCGKSINNTTSESQLKSMMDSSSGLMKDLAFMMDSGGLSSKGFKDLTNSTADALNTVTSAFGDGKVSGIMSRVINLGGEVLSGNNIIMPDIYQSTDIQESYGLTVHLKAPYGTKLGYYLDIFVPMMHLLALAIPRQAIGNSYSSPFMIKCYVDGMFTCNLGIVESLSINSVTETRTIDGLPTEVDVTLNIRDLYSDLMLSPSSDPLLFVNNSSLVEYLATLCGLSLVTPKLDTKLKFTMNTIGKSITDIPANVSATIKENLAENISKYTKLTW